MDSTDQGAVLSLRKRLNALETEKLNAVAAANQEICLLSSDIARLRAQLEKGEVVKQNLEYELAKTNKDLATERRLAAERETHSAENAENLLRKISELSGHNEQLVAELQSAHDSLAQESSRLGCAIQEKETLLSQQSDRVTSLSEAKGELQSNLQQKQRIIETLEAEIERVQTSNRQIADDTKQQRWETDVLRDKNAKMMQDLKEAYDQIRALEETIEAERASHIQTKFNCDLVQLRVRDLEAALNAEKAGKNEAMTDLKKCAGHIRELQQSCDDERRSTLNAKNKLSRAEKDLDALKRELAAELTDKRTCMESMSSELIRQQTELGQLKTELCKTKKKQASIEEAHAVAVAELHLILSYGDVETKKVHQSKSPVNAKVLLNAVQNVRELVLSCKKSNSSLTVELSAQKRQADKLSHDLKDCKEKLSAKGKSLREAEAAVARADTATRQSADECRHLGDECQRLKGELQQLRHGLLEQQAQGQQLRDQTSATFLALLRQQLDTVTLVFDRSQSQSIASRLSAEPQDWNDLALLVNEQVSNLVSLYSRSQEKVSELENVASERSRTIEELHASHTEQLERLARGSDEQSRQWLRQKTELEKHYAGLLEEATARNKQLQKEADNAWRKVRSVSDAQHSIDTTCAQLQSQLALNRRDVDCLLAATALLAGALYPMVRRTVELSAQRETLAAQVMQFEAFKHQVADLVSAMKIDSSPDVDYRRSAEPVARVSAVLRFRSAAIAVLAANRLARWSSATKNHSLFTSCVEFPGITAAQVPVVIVSRQQNDESCPRDANSRGTSDTENANSWFSGSELHALVVAAMADLQTLNDTSAIVDIKNAAITARRCFGKMLLDLSKYFQHGNELPHKQSSSATGNVSLLTGLKRGLWFAFGDRIDDARQIPPYASSADILDGLQHCILDFTNRLHCAEVDRRDLRVQLAMQTQCRGAAQAGAGAGQSAQQGRFIGPASGRNEYVAVGTANGSIECGPGVVGGSTSSGGEPASTGELEERVPVGIVGAEKQTQTDLMEVVERTVHRQSPSVEELQKKIAELRQEKATLEDNVRDAEAALRTVAKDKQALIGYVASVENALGPRDEAASTSDWPPERLLPADLGDAVSLHRQSASLTSVRALVMSFVLAHNRLICRLAACRDDGNHLRRHVDRLKLELDSALASRRNELGDAGVGESENRKPSQLASINGQQRFAPDIYATPCEVTVTLNENGANKNGANKQPTSAPATIQTVVRQTKSAEAQPKVAPKKSRLARYSPPVRVAPRQKHPGTVVMTTTAAGTSHRHH